MNDRLISPVSEDGMPLVTFALIAYNQENYIREAVAGAFAQTYSPLEIILSDDASTDQTYEIMKGLADAYSGKHKLSLNCNQFNQGIGRHINKVTDIAQGDLIVIAAGDDVSVPNRTEILTSAWLASGRRAMSLHSAYTEMDERGNVIEVKQNRYAKCFTSIDRCIAGNLHVTGATHAWAKELFRVFGPLRDDLIHEDRAIPLRSMLLGEVKYVDMPLVYYRNSVGISRGFGKGGLTEELYGSGAIAAERYYVDYQQKYQDLLKIGADRGLLKLCNKRLQEQRFVKSLSGKESAKLKLFFIALLSGAGMWFSVNQLFKYTFPGMTVIKRKIASIVRRILRMQRK